MSRKRKRLNRKHRRSGHARLTNRRRGVDPGPRHRLTAGRTGMVHAKKNKSRRHPKKNPPPTPETSP